MKPYRSRVYLLAAFGMILMVLKTILLLRDQVMLDEFQHLHAAWYIFQGNTPYVDFFEHHPPLLYYLLQPIFHLIPSGFSLILAVRALMLGLNLLIFGLVYAVTKNAFGKGVALLAVTLTLTEVLFFEHGFKVLTDLPALACTLGMVLCLQKSLDQRFRLWSLLAGFFFGAAVLFTPKVVFLGLGVAVWGWIYLKEKRYEWALWAGIGGILSLAFMTMLIGIDAFPAFWKNCIALNFHWKARHAPTRHIMHMIGQNAPLWAAAVLGVIYYFLSKELWQGLHSKSILLIFILLSFGLGTLLIPVVWTEYFVGVAPYGAIVGAWALDQIWRQFQQGANGVLLNPILVRKIYLTGAGIIFLGIVYTFKSSWMWDDDLLGLILSGVFLAMVILIMWFYSKGNVSWVQIISLLLLILVPTVKEAYLTLHASNFEDREKLRWVEMNVPSDGYVFDGYSGYGVFRKHAYPYWFLHEEVQMMLSHDQLSQGVINSLEEKRPELVIYDHHIQALPDTVQLYLKQSYRPVEISSFQVLK